jgi:hypothetical protein
MLSEYEARRVQEDLRRIDNAPRPAETLAIVLVIGLGLGWIAALASQQQPGAAEQPVQRVASACARDVSATMVVREKVGSTRCISGCR